MRKVVAIFLGLIFIVGIQSIGFPADFPTRPIRDIVPFAPGGTMDLMARLLSKPLEKELGTRILIEHIPGGLTKLATMECMNAKPDGYTIMQATELTWVSGYYSKVFDSKVWEKMTPIVNIATQPHGLWAVRADSPYKTLADLIKAAKEKPGAMTIGISSSGVFDVIVNTAEKATGIKLKHVPFTGAGPVETALLGGHIDIRFCTAGEAITMIRAGKVRGIANQTQQRDPGLPDVPTFKELGYDVMTLTATRSLWGPPKMPKNIVDIYVKAIRKATKDPEFVKTVQETFLNHVNFWTGQEMLQKGVLTLEKQLAQPLTEFFRK